MILDIIKKIDELESFDSETIMRTFSFEERRLLCTQAEALFFDSYYHRNKENKIEAFLDKIVKERIVIFTEKELKQLEQDANYFRDDEFIYSQMSDEQLLEKMLEEDYRAYRIYRYIKSDETIYKIVELYMNNELSEYYVDNIAEIVSSAKSDEFKIKCLQLLSKLPRKLRISDYDRMQIISSLSTDDEKIKYLGLIPNNLKSSVITSMDSDDTKVRYINLFSRDKGDIIRSLEDDELKEFYFKKYYRLIGGSTKSRIIASFKDEELVRKYLPLINGNENIVEFLYVCRNDDICNEIAQKITSDKHLIEAIRQIRNSKYQLELVKRIRNLKVLFKDEDYISCNLQYESFQYLMPKLTDEQQSLVIRNVQYPDNILLLTEIRDFNKALEYLGHVEDYSFGQYDEKLNPLVEYLANNLNINPERLHRLVNQTGVLILKYLNNKNIIDCLNLSDEDFEKYMMLIRPENQRMDMDSVNDVLNASLNRRFKVERKEDNEIFHNFQLAIEKRDTRKLKELFEKLSTLINVEAKIENLDEFIELLVSRDVQAINRLHDMTQDYIRISKDNYVREHMAESREKIVSTVVDRGEYIKIILASYETEALIKIIKKIKDKIPESNLQELIEDKELLTSLIEYKKDPKKYGAPSKEIKRQLKNLNIILNYVYKYRAPNVTGYDYLNEAVVTAEEAPQPNMEGLIFMLTEMDVSELRDTVFRNEELYQELLKFVEKYKILGWTDSVKELASSSGLIVYDSTIAALISNFEAITRNLSEKVAKGEIPRATISHIIDLAACYDSDSMIYKYIFGRDNFILLKNNPGPFKSEMNAEERTKKAFEFIRQIKSRDSITTPPIDKDYQLSNTKGLHVRLGHVNSLDNLTYGERTGACMRIGGAGNSLFEFCLLNKNGFHVEFSNPQTGEFVSRVSGFRNGNTVFLNQLRFSKSPSYDSNDLIEAVKLVAQDIIELSKNSNYPIDNVVISNGYAMEKSKEKSTDLGVKNIKKGYESFYTDVYESAIILATSSEDREFVPLTLAARGLPEYEPLRDRMRTYKDEQAAMKMNEMIALDEYLSGKPIEEIEINLDIDVNTCYMGNDWYISISNDGQITTYIMKSCKDKEKTEQEMKRILAIIKEKSEKQIEMLSQQEDYSTGTSMHM